MFWGLFLCYQFYLSVSGESIECCELCDYSKSCDSGKSGYSGCGWEIWCKLSILVMIVNMLQKSGWTTIKCGNSAGESDD